METRAPDDVMDERLRAAAGRLRATAPSPETTETVLAELRRPGALRRLWWVLPTGLVAAAAATVGVLTLAGQQDEAVPAVPAGTPSVTPAPTAPAIPLATPPATPPATPESTVEAGVTIPPTIPPVDPAFVGDPPLYASAAAFGCPNTLSQIAAALPPGDSPVAMLRCDGRDALALTAEQVGIRLRLQPDRSWSLVGQGTQFDCVAPAPCEIWGANDEVVGLLPIPPTSVLLRDLGDLGDLPPVDVTTQVEEQAALVEVSDPTLVARSLGARLADGQDPAPTVTVEVVAGADVFLITLTGLGDDSIGEVTYVVWYDASPPVPTVERAFLISRCSRGITVDEAGEPLDLCL